MARKLESNYAKMLQEHKRIVESLERLSSVAKRENKPEQARFAERLILQGNQRNAVLEKGSRER